MVVLRFDRRLEQIPAVSPCYHGDDNDKNQQKYRMQHFAFIRIKWVILDHKNKYKNKNGKNMQTYIAGKKHLNI